MNNDYVYVVDRKGNPLMPTKNHCKVRHLLEEGRAVAIGNDPLVIRLKYDVPGYTQPIHAGVDTGRENIGTAASLDSGENIYLADTRTNNKSIKGKIQDRAGFRMERRRHDRQGKQRKALKDDTAIENGKDDICRSKIPCKSKEVTYPGADKPVTHKIIQGKEGKFNNRKRPEGWITPSARQVVQVTMNEVQYMTKIMPVSRLAMERVSFDFQKLENEDIRRWEYGKGPLYGYKSYKDYIDDEQHGKCLLCGKKRIEYYHHINPQKDNKYDHVSNIAGLCYDCHYGKEGVHQCQEAADQLKELKAGSVQRYSVGLLNSVMPVLIEEADRFCREDGIGFYVTDGKETAATREKYNLPKDHCVDAYAISLSGRDVDQAKIQLADTIHIRRRFKKKSKNIISARNQREYYLDGKLVAKNRHKATDQKHDSLEEFMAKYAESHTAKECNQLMHRLDIRPAKRTYTYHKEGLKAPAHPGDVISYAKPRKVKGDTKRMTFVAVGVEYTDVVYKKKGIVRVEREWKISYGDGNKTVKAKFCRPISSGCVQTIHREKTTAYLKNVEAETRKLQERTKRQTAKAKKAV